MRLIFSSDYITDTTLVDEYSRQTYATTSSTFLRHTDILKFGSNPAGPSNIATVNFHNWGPDTITLGGQELVAKEFITKPSWFSRFVSTFSSSTIAYLMHALRSRRVFTASNGTTYEWEGIGNTWIVRGSVSLIA